MHNCNSLENLQKRYCRRVFDVKCKTYSYLHFIYSWGKVSGARDSAKVSEEVKDADDVCFGERGARPG